MLGMSSTCCLSHFLCALNTQNEDNLWWNMGYIFIVPNIRINNLSLFVKIRPKWSLLLEEVPYLYVSLTYYHVRIMHLFKK